MPGPSATNEPWKPQCINGRVRRSGAIFSIEMMMVLTILIPLMFALTEFSLLWSANHTLKAASYAAAREASLPAVSEEAREAAARTAAERVLGDEKFIDQYILSEFNPGLHTGDPVVVELQLPMTAAAPDLLAMIGISIEDKELRAQSVMRRE
jgi:Flp pilus assembly protein TadG